ALILIDGVEGDLNTLDPADIESFSVLKDASATAVYGVRGANGVVIVTTKRGKAGKLTVNFKTNATYSYSP
ncbi:TonB-dependent receptor plug domain-containing protein, partial [Phocaeicola vulgatus]